MEKIKNYLKFGIFLICLSLFLWNCTLDEKNNDFSKKENQITSINTVSFQDAISSFNSKKEKTQNTNAKLNEDVFIVTPDWNSLQYTDVAYTDADLTTANSSINRDGNYQSQLHFINVNNVIKSVVFTIYKDIIDDNGNVIDGRIFFNDLNGRFLDGYVIENGLFTERYIVQSQTQQASLFPLMLLQSSAEEDCWNADNLDMFDGGILDTVDLGNLTTTGNEDGGGTEETGGYSDSYNWYYSSGTSGGDTTLGNYLNNATGGNTLPSGQGGNGLSSGQINAAAGAVLIAMPVKPGEDGSCPEGYIINPTTGDCEPICDGGKIYNSTTEQCECPDNLVEDKDGNCVSKPCEGDPVKGGLEIAPQKGSSGTKGALYGCTRYGGSCTSSDGRTKSHGGIDIKSEYGDPIYAMYDGFIYTSKNDPDGAGYYTRIQSTINGETIIVCYFHLQEENRELATNNPLNYVQAGDIIGYQGDSGNLKKAIARGGVDSHVHIEVRKHDGGSSWGFSHFDLVDPRDYFATTIDSNGVSTPNTNDCNN